MKKINVFISHSYNGDEALASSLYKTFTKLGLNSFNHDTLSGKLKPIFTGGSDWDDLIISYRRGGRFAPTQEQSDFRLREIMVDNIAKQDVIVVLWSELYFQKFWTHCELKAALSLGIPIIIIILDGYRLYSELEKGVQCGKIPLFKFNSTFTPIEVYKAILETIKISANQQPSILWDNGLVRNFIQIEHPSLGVYELQQSFFTWEEMKKFEITEPPENSKMDDIGGNCSYNYLKNYCHFLNIQSPLFRYRLPTEVEWQFAARSGRKNGSVSNLSKESETNPNVIRNNWGLIFEQNAYEWTSTPCEWIEYMGWVQPVDIKDKEFDPNRNYVVTSINSEVLGSDGISYPKVMHHNSNDIKLGFRLIREPRKDINTDHVFSSRHKNIARELLSARNPEEFEKTVERFMELGQISRYFRGYLEHCIDQNTLYLANELLIQMLEVDYVPPLSMPPYLYNYFTTKLEEVFINDRPIERFEDLLINLKEESLLGREFAEVLYYSVLKNNKFNLPRISLNSYWTMCINNLDSHHEELLFKYNNLPKGL